MLTGSHEPEEVVSRPVCVGIACYHFGGSVGSLIVT